MKINVTLQRNLQKIAKKYLKLEAILKLGETFFWPILDSLFLNVTFGDMFCTPLPPYYPLSL